MMIGVSKHFPRMMAAVAANDYYARTRYIGRDLAGPPRSGSSVSAASDAGSGLRRTLHLE